MKTVLVVDDEPKIVQLARDYLEHAGFAVVSASDGKAALAAARSSRPDLVVLDLGLPELDGLDVARALRRDSTVPIVMLTGRGDEADKIAGLEIGADDYVTKPFSPKELVARIRAVLRRTERPQEPQSCPREEASARPSCTRREQQRKGREPGASLNLLIVKWVPAVA